MARLIEYYDDEVVFKLRQKGREPSLQRRPRRDPRLGQRTDINYGILLGNNKHLTSHYPGID